jgi:hypothetical protein
MRRRRFLTLVVGAVATRPQLVRAQSERFRRIGALMAYQENDAEAQKYVSVFWDNRATSRPLKCLLLAQSGHE